MKMAIHLHGKKFIQMLKKSLNRYDILNYIGSNGYELAGDFLQRRGGAPTLRINEAPKLFYDKSFVLPESVCSKPCNVGQRVFF